MHERYDTALHIIGAQNRELGMSYGQRSAEEKVTKYCGAELLAELDKRGVWLLRMP